MELSEPLSSVPEGSGYPVGKATPPAVPESGSTLESSGSMGVGVAEGKAVEAAFWFVDWARER